MAIEEDDDGGVGIPEWVVTFGDMMSLLLTFFIMLVSLSEIKEEEKYQALVESVRRTFGHENSRMSLVPGNLKPRNSALKNISAMGRAKRMDVLKGGDKTQAPTGDHPRVMIVRPGTKTAVGTVVYFPEGGVELDEAQKSVLRQEVHVIQGKPQKIEVRGHTSLRPVPAGSDYRDNYDLAYARCRAVIRYMVDVMDVNPERIRISVAGANEPVHIGTEPEKQVLNPRVEIYLLDEVVSDYLGTEQELKGRFIEEPGNP